MDFSFCHSGWLWSVTKALLKCTIFDHGSLVSLSLCVQTSSDYTTNCNYAISADLGTSLALAAFFPLSTCKQMINDEMAFLHGAQEYKRKQLQCFWRLVSSVGPNVLATFLLHLLHYLYFKRFFYLLYLTYLTLGIVFICKYFFNHS